MYFAFYNLMVWIDCTIYLHYAGIIIIIVTRLLLSQSERFTLSQFVQSIVPHFFVYLNLEGYSDLMKSCRPIC